MDGPGIPSQFNGRRSSRMNSLIKEKRASILASDLKRLSRRASTKLGLLLNRRNTTQIEQIILGNPLANLEILQVEEKNSNPSKKHTIRKTMYRALATLLNIENDEDIDIEREAAVNPEFELNLSHLEYENSVKINSDMQKKDGIFFVIEMNFLKRSNLYRDNFPFLEFRKKILFYMKKISYICFKIIKNPLFEYCSLIVIIMNSMTLALQDPTLPDDPTLSKFEFSFLILYTIEMCLKIMGYGFVFCKGAYLRDGWNFLDFVIVTTAYIPYMVGADSGVNLSGLRSLRVLRPLRTISTIKSLKTLIQALFQALPLLFDTLCILLFFFLIFAIAGLQLYSGLLKNRCFEEISGKIHPDNIRCGNLDCPTGYTCAKFFDNPNWGGTNFDNIFSSFLMVFVCVTLEGWTEIMNYFRTTFSEFVVVYFFVLVFVGAFFLLNITLAVIKSAFSDSQLRKNEPDDERKRKYGEWIDFTQYLEYLRDWEELQKKKKAINYKPPPTKFVLFLKKLSKWCPRSQKSKTIDLLKKMRTLREEPSLAVPVAGNIEDQKITSINKIEAEHRFSKSEVLPMKSLGDKEIDLPIEKPASNTAGPTKRVFSKKFDSILNKTIINSSGTKKVLPYMAIANITNSLQSTINNFINNTQGTLVDDEDVIVARDNKGHDDFLSEMKEENVPENEEDDQTKQKFMSCSLNIKKPTFVNYRHTSSDYFKKLKEKKPGSKIMRFDKIHQSPTEFSTEPSKSISGDSGQESSAIVIDKMKTLKQKIKIVPLSNAPASNSGVNLEKIIEINEDHRQNELKEDENFQFKLIRKLTNFSLESSQKSSSEKSENESRGENDLDDTLDGDSDFSIGCVKLDDEELKRLEKKNKKKFMKRKVRQVNAEIPFDFQVSKPKSRNDLERDTLNSIWDKKTTSQTPYVFADEEKFPRRRSTRQGSQFKKIVQRRRSAFITMDDEMEREKQKLEIQNQDKILNNVFNKINPKYKEVAVDHDKEYRATSLVDVLEEKIKKQEEEMKENRRKQMLDGSFKMYFKLSNTKAKNSKSQKNQSKRNSATSQTNDLKKSKKRSRNNSFRVPSLRSQKNLFEKSENIFDVSIKRLGLEKSNISANDVSSFIHIRTNNDPMTPRSGLLVSSPLRSPHRKRKKIPLEFDPKNTTAEIALEKCFAMNLEADAEKKAEEREKEAFIGFEQLYENIRDEDLKKQKIAKHNWNVTDVLRGSKDRINYLNSIKRALMIQKKLIWIPGKMGLVIAFRSKVKAFIETKLFEQIIIISVIINTCILSMDGLFTDDNTLELFKTFNLTFTIIFAIEMGLKIIAIGLKSYVRDTMNIFDGAIVILSIVEVLFLSGSSKAVSAFRTVRIFRTFRVLRVTKLLRSLDFMKVIIRVVSRSLQSFTYIALLLLLFIFIYSLLGMQVYGGNLNLDDVDVNLTFDNFNGSFLAVFQIMTLENWQSLLYICLRSSVSPIITTVFMISWIFIGNYVLLNLFLAILLDGFSMDPREVESGDEESDGDVDKQKQYEMMMEKKLQEERNLDRQVKEIVDDDDDEQIDNDIHLSRKSHHNKGPLFTEVKCEKSLFLFSKLNPIRILFYRLVHHPNFESLILVMIIVSSIKLAFDTYLPEEDSQDSYDIKLLAGSVSVDYFFNIFFTVECLIKIISFGFCIEQGSYLREPWNVMDFFIVCSAMLDMSLESINLPIIKIFRLLRTLRPLRFITHNINLKIVVLCLINSVGAIMNVLIVVLLIWLMFAILGISLLQNKMGYCNFPKVSDRYGVSKERCLEQNKEWKIHDVNFDNIFSSMITLFIIGSLEGWPDIMSKCMDGDDEEFGPSKNASAFVSYYFIFFILVGSFFFLNLFTGAIFFHFNQAHKNEKEKSSKLSGLMTEEQIRWIEMQKKIIRAKPEYDKTKRPEGRYRLLVYHLVNSGLFEVTIMTCIIFNILVMAMVYDDSPDAYNNYLEIVNTVFTAVFITEMVLKIFSFGFKAYWFDPWNKFDFFVVMASIIDILMSVMGQDFISFLRVGPQLARVFRILRVSRLFKLVKSLGGLQKLIQTMILTLPSLVNVGALSFLVLFIYSILGCFLFKNAEYGDVIDRFTNFDNFHNAIILLFRCCTGEDWYRIMFELRSANSFSPIFFITFLLISTFIMLNLFILIILEQFEEFQRGGQDPFDSYQENLENFRKTWSIYSMHYYGVKVNEKCLIDFLRTLPPPLGYGQKETKPNVAKGLLQMNLEADGEGCVYFNDLLFATMKRGFGEAAIKDNVDLIKQDIQEKKKEVTKFMRELELKTRFKLDKVKKKNLRREAKLRKKVQATLGMNTKVNPFFFILYVKMAFQSLRRFTEEAYRLNKVDRLEGQHSESILRYSREELWESESPSLVDIEENSDDESNTDSQVGNEEENIDQPTSITYKIRKQSTKKLTLEFENNFQINNGQDHYENEDWNSSNKVNRRSSNPLFKRPDLLISTQHNHEEDTDGNGFQNKRITKRASQEFNNAKMNLKQPSKEDFLGVDNLGFNKYGGSQISERSEEEDEGEIESKFKVFKKNPLTIITPKVGERNLDNPVQYFDLEKDDKSYGQPTSQDRLNTDKDYKPSLMNIRRFDEDDF